MSKRSHYCNLWVLPIALILSFAWSTTSSGQDTIMEDSILEQIIQPQKEASYPVLYRGDTLFYLHSSAGAFSPRERAVRAASVIKSLESLIPEAYDSLYSVDMANRTVIYWKDRALHSIETGDARAEGKDRTTLAQEQIDAIRQALEKHYEATRTDNLLRQIVMFVIFLFVLILLIVGISRFFRRFIRNLEKKYALDTEESPGKRKMAHKFATEMKHKSILAGLRLFRFLVIVLLLYFYLPILFRQLYYTRNFANWLFDQIMIPVNFVWTAFVGYIDKLIFIIVIVVITYYFIKFLRSIAHLIANHTLIIPGFYPDWAKPTFNLVKVFIIAFAAIIIIPYLPGSGSDAFRGISIFAGVLLSLGSAGAVSNMVSGVVITYMRPFNVGDYILMDQTIGEVRSKNLLVTKLCTLKNEEITIPNGAILNKGVKNYTRYAKERGLILHTTVTIGYDVPWKDVHEVLIEAALKTNNIEKEPKPFVLQKSLGDFSVAYELNATTRQFKNAMKTYSELHGHIQDGFNGAGIEILSPTYSAIRDGNTVTNPEEFRGADYIPAAFRFEGPIPFFKKNKEEGGDS